MALHFYPPFHVHKYISGTFQEVQVTEKLTSDIQAASVFFAIMAE